MTQPVVKAKRVYNRYVANQTLEDFSLRYTAKSVRQKSSFTVSNAAVGSISFLALEVMGAILACYYGLNHLVYALLIGVPLIFLISKPIAFYAVKYNVDIDLLTRGAGFGYLGSSITSIVYATFTFIFFAFESTILANMLRLIFDVPIYLGYLLSSIVVIPLILKGFSFISKFQQITQPVWCILQLLSIIGAVILVKDHKEIFSAFDNPKENFNILFLGYVISILLSLISQIGEQVDYLRFMPDESKSNKRSRFLGTLIAGPGWIVIGGIKILIGAVLSVYLFSKGALFENGIDPNLMYYDAFRALVTEDTYVSHVLVIALVVIFVALSQIKINMTNGYAGSLACSNFFSRLTHTHPGRVVWVFFSIIVAYILTNFGSYNITALVLRVYSIVAVAWCGTLVADLTINKRIGLSPKNIEFKRAYLFDINPVGIGSMIISAIFGFVAISGVLGEILNAYSSIFTLALTFVFCPFFAYITKGKYYLSRKVIAVKGKHVCSICNNSFDGEDMCYCPRYGGYICSLCCTLDSCCLDECKKHAAIHNQILGILPKRMKNSFSIAALRFTTHLLIYTVVNFSVIYTTYIMVRGYFSSDARHSLVSGFILCFCTFEFIFCILSLMYTFVEDSRMRASREYHNQNMILEKEILKRKRTEKLLSNEKKKAESANRAKNRYLSGISHELRTPLNTITGYGQILSQAEDIPNRHLKSINIMCRSCDYLANLIEGLLDISKIEAGRLDLHYENMNLLLMLEELTEYFGSLCEKKNLKFKADISNNIPKLVHTDAKRLRQILTNLLSNAVKYTAKGGIEFTVRYRNEVADFIVKDTGIGIKESDRKRIFEPFNRLDDAKTQASGTGLGLTITKLLVTIMGGDLSVTSESGKGSTFSLKIKLSKAFVDSDFVTLERRVIGYREQKDRQFRVIEVDDNENHRELIRAILEPVGFNVDMADCPDAVLARLDLSDIDLFLVDISMPGHDGWYLLEKLRTMKIGAPVIMVSAEVSEGNVSDTLKHMHNGYIIKPFKQKHIFDAIARVLPINYIYKEDSSLTSNALSSTQKKQNSNEFLGEDSENSVNIKNYSLLAETLKHSSDTSSEVLSIKRLNLSGDIKNSFNTYLDIGYVKGLRKLIDKYVKSGDLSKEDSIHLERLLDDMNLNAFMKMINEV